METHAYHFMCAFDTYVYVYVNIYMCIESGLFKNFHKTSRPMRTMEALSYQCIYISLANALAILQSCTKHAKSSKYGWFVVCAWYQINTPQLQTAKVQYSKIRNAAVTIHRCYFLN